MQLSSTAVIKGGFRAPPGRLCPRAAPLRSQSGLPHSLQPAGARLAPRLAPQGGGAANGVAVGRWARPRPLVSCPAVEPGAPEAEGEPSSGRGELGAVLDTARGHAFRQLMRVEADGAYVGLVTGAYEGDDRAALGAAGRRRVTELVGGVTRWRRWLDFQLLSFYHGNPDGMELTLKQVLRLGLYELFKTRAPSHAVVNEYVELSKEAVRPQAGALVNSVLRAADRAIQAGEIPSIPVEGPPRARSRALATKHSHPTWIVRRWLDRYGQEECEALLEWNNARPTYGVRANAANGMAAPALLEKAAELGADVELSPYLPEEFVRVRGGLQSLLAAGMLEEGVCAVQDESAALVVALLDPQPGDTVLDGCAAPGGKALFSAARMKGEGRVVALDISAPRLEALRGTAERLGVGGMVETRPLDLRHLAPALRKRAGKGTGSDPAGVFDRVLVDAPCSGLGVLCKRADLRWRRTAESMPELTALQADLLGAAAPLVRPGGVLVYSTCSVEPEENEEQVARFLAAHPDFELEPASGLSAVPEGMTSEGGEFLATLPQRHGMDGAFGARMRRKARDA